MTRPIQMMIARSGIALLLGAGCGGGSDVGPPGPGTDGGQGTLHADDTGTDVPTGGATGVDTSTGAATDNDDGPPKPTCEVDPMDTPGHFVAADAHEDGDGSIESPWTLAGALAHPEAVRAGDTIWMRGGIYAGDFDARLAGEEGNHVTLRSHPGERPIIDGTLEVGGRWAIYRDLEIMSSDPVRETRIEGSTPADLEHRGKGVVITGANTRMVNCYLHDGSRGFTFWKGAVDSELYGNIVFNGGWSAPDRGHGHALYTQNEDGTKLVADNLMFNQFGRGVQVYGSSTSFLKGYHFEGNVHFNEEFLVGGEEGPVAEDITIRNNYMYNSQVRMGFVNSEHLDTTITDNHLVNHGDFPLRVQRWQSVDIARNRIHGGTRLAWLRHPVAPDVQIWDDNQYFATDAGSGFEIHGTGTLDFAGWQAATGFDATSTLSAPPVDPEVFVRPNAYERGRAHVIIYNWDERDEVVVDLSGAGLEPGERYALHNAQHYLEESLEGIYDGTPVTIPMTGWTVAIPIGYHEPLSPVTFPRFGVFVLRSLGCE